MSDAARTAHPLSDADDARLRAAHHELRGAVAAYEPFASPPITLHDASKMAAAQERVQAAEDELWRLREELLGWVRPAWAPSASLTADWFSDEDAVYDDLPEPTAP